MDASALAFAPDRKSVAGSVMGMAVGRRRMLVPDFEFSLGAAKAKVAKVQEEAMPAGFVPFYNSPLFDRLLAPLLLYFTALLQHDALVRCQERARASHTADACSPALLVGRLQELLHEADAQRLALSGAYCEIILRHSSFRNQQQDRRFFEALYAALAALLAEAFDRLGRTAAVEQELGRLFRGKHFNLAARKHGPQRSVDSLTVMQLWQVKHGTNNRALHAQLISSLSEKAPQLSVQVASVSNTPLVRQAISSPFVSCALLADPAERDALLALPYSRKSRAGGGGSSGVQSRNLLGSQTHLQQPHKLLLGAAGVPGAAGSGEPPQQQALPTPRAAGRPGVTGRGLSSPLTPSAGPAPAAAAGAGAAAPPLAPPTPGGGPRSSTMRPFQGAVAALPEASGLPYDEGYAYLCLLRRCVLYGPTLGLPTAPGTTGGSGRPGMASMTGAALGTGGGAGPGALSSCSSVVYSRA